MCAYVLMKILESAPSRYDKGINIITLGRINEAYDRLTSHVKKGMYVLDIGCGTGLLTLRAALRGARVKGIDVNPEMLEIAWRRLDKASVSEQVELCEMGVIELDDEDSNKYDAVTCGLVLSELSEDEIKYALELIMNILKPGVYY